MSKQLWSHPPLYGSRRHRYPRNYEGDPIHYTPPINSECTYICTCKPFSVCLCTPVSSSESFPASTVLLQLLNSPCVCVCQIVRMCTCACVQRIQRWFCAQLFDGWTVILRLYASEGHGLKGKSPDFTLQPYGLLRFPLENRSKPEVNTGPQ